MPAPRVLACAVVFALSAGCDGGLPAWMGGAETAAAPALDAGQLERMQRANALFEQAYVATVPEKIPLFRKLIAQYPESEHVPKAYEHLVLHLVNEGRFPEAFETAQAFGERFHRAFGVANGFNLVLRGHVKLAPGQKVLDEVAVLDARERWIQRALDHKQAFSESDRAFLHYVAGWHHLDRAGVQVARKAELYETAAGEFAKAASLDFGDERRLFEVDTAWYLGRVRALQGDRERAKAHFEAALEMRRRWNIGWPEEAILDQFRGLGLEPQIE